MMFQLGWCSGKGEHLGMHTGRWNTEQSSTKDREFSK